MIKIFVEGETYRNVKFDRDIMVLAIAKESNDEVILAILWVDRDSLESVGGDSLTVKRADFKDWIELKL